MANSDGIGVPHPEKAPEAHGGSGGSGGGSGGGLAVRAALTSTSTGSSSSSTLTTTRTTTATRITVDEPAGHAGSGALAGHGGSGGGLGVVSKPPTTTTTLQVGVGVVHPEATPPPNSKAGSGSLPTTHPTPKAGSGQLPTATPAPTQRAGSGQLPTGKSSALPSISAQVSTSVASVVLPAPTPAPESSSVFGSTTSIVVVLVLGAVILAGYRRFKGRLARSGYTNIDSRGGWQTVDTMDDEFGLDDARSPTGLGSSKGAVEMSERNLASNKADAIGLASNLAFGDEENLDEFFGGSLSNSYQAASSGSKVTDDLFTGGSVREVSVVDGQLTF